MKAITLTVTVDAEALGDLLALAIEKGTTRCTQAVAKGIEQRAVEEKAEIRTKMTPLEASRHAHFGGQKPPDDQGLLIDTRQASKLLNVSARTLWSMYNSGQMPTPIRIGRAVR